MKYFVLRNSTIEYCVDKYIHLTGAGVEYSGYDDISQIDNACDRYLWFYTVPYKAQSEVVAGEIANYASQFAYIVSLVDKSKMIIALTAEQIFEINSITSDFQVKDAINHYNQTLREIAHSNPNVKIVDFSKFTNNYAQSQLVDWKYYFISKTAINPKLSRDFAVWFDAQVKAIEMSRKKCLILDLDNTLWGGIVGEDGVHGIKIGGDYPGSAYELFQQYILELQRQGVILALCSKNNESDIKQVWQENKNNLITEQHLSAWRINWQNKAINIDELSKELNIGLDSMVFIDDNPTERELVKTMLPSVVVPDFVEHPYDLPKLIQDIANKYFSIHTLTSEDLSKTEQYKANQQRSSFESSFASLDEYIKGLGIKLDIQPICQATIERAAQMTQKTNQFNLTTKRYTVGDIQSIIDSNGIGYTISVSDKFGDNGITGLILISNRNNEYEIDTFLMSCRVLGKGIENEFLTAVLIKTKEIGVEQIKAQYIATLKNGQVEDFYKKFGFTEIAQNIYIANLLEFNLNQTEKYSIL